MSEARPVSRSSIDGHVYKVFPSDLNANYSVFGGLVMANCDRLALVVAERHSGRTCVTAAVDSMYFRAPAREDDTLIFRASVNRVFRSSMEIGIRVVAESSRSGETRHVVSAYFTFVALGDDDKPVEAPSVQPETEAQHRRHVEADIRRRSRLTTRQQLEDQRQHQP